MKTHDEVQAEIERIESERSYLRSIGVFQLHDNTKVNAKIEALTWVLADTQCAPDVYTTIES